MANKMQEWFESGLQQWDITRDAPTSASKFPEPRQTSMFGWTPPIGYMASFKNLCNKRGDIDFDSYWKADSDAELYHFIRQTSPTSTACSGRPCWKARTSAKPTKVNVHGYRPSTAPRCPSPRAPSSRRPPISSTWIRSACVTTTPPSSTAASTIWT